jgi:O-antigen ligase
LFFGLGLGSEFANAVGRTSLSGRDEIWHAVLSQQANPLVGAGYESFWLGPRVDRIAAITGQRINESHNGYLEGYLNLGYVGISLLLLFVAVAYWNICKRFKSAPGIATLALAIWTAFIFHNCTEVDFRSGLMWFVLVLAALAAAESKRQKTGESAAGYRLQAKEQLPSPLQVTLQGIR